MPSRAIPESPTAILTPPKPLSAFKRLSPKVALYEPRTPFNNGSLDAPTTILLCSWMNASAKHTDYYTRTYMSLFPDARIIIITMNINEFLFQSETRRRVDVKEAISAMLAPDQNHERLFVHALSNGGARRAYGVAGAYRSLTGKPLPVKAFLLDSAPGIPQFRRDLHALNVTAKKLSWLAWLPYWIVTLASVCAVFVSVNWMPKWFWRELVWGPTEGTNDMNLFNEDCVKGYVYSKEDLAIDWKNVESHAAVAEEKGYKVVKKRVQGAEHVQMFRGKGGEEAYWGFVKRVWGMGMSTGEE